MRHYFSKEVQLDETEVISAVRQWAYPMKHHKHIDPLMKRMNLPQAVLQQSLDLLPQLNRWKDNK